MPLKESIFLGCEDILEANPNMQSGPQLIKPPGSDASMLVYCDVTGPDEVWTVIQRRTDGILDFARTWEEYKYARAPKKITALPVLH